MDALMLALLIVAVVLAGQEIIESDGRCMLCWAIGALAFAMMIPMLV